MKKTFLELLKYLKNPVLEEDTNTDFTYRSKKFGALLIICLLTGVVISPLFSIIEALGLVNMEDHAIEDMMKRFSTTEIFLFAVVLAPLLEELFFRAPLTLFKDPKIFKWAFYTFAIIFGMIHISNFGITLNVILLAPILVAPQIILGGYLGFIRVRFGLLWSIALHAFYNGVLMALTLAPELF
ncbi:MULTISPECIES: CPBP family intramembrane glutamic endopeptidase [unclassified Polaribacter]|uniref:CPBP family intramembrane glutamic endopeptidase n=1 Tax=unclassified Polaribacter TaxID=196858 RepID=UPI0011BE762D|nr:MULTISPECIES: CPBP family intramembrane glutamic endopeptidase [unclassified Polaribacter]TXD50887.1 CPBP family intramembrane metalloprotease [Polaribacter sp. IC063]TXD57560.1 CPBP family intramembrane metalloprotease [Polaribacter sp. IC066]